MSTWQQSSVTDFFTHHNWEGKQEATKVVQGTNPKPISVSQLVEKVETQTRNDKPLVFPQHLATPTPIADWHLLSVEEMFSQQNWEGTSPMTQGLTPVTSSPSKPAASQAPVNLAPPTMGKTVKGTPSLGLPVQDFMACISWDGIPAIAVLPELKQPDQNNNNGDDHITLDDFSQLF